MHFYTRSSRAEQTHKTITLSRSFSTSSTSRNSKNVNMPRGSKKKRHRPSSSRAAHLIQPLRSLLVLSTASSVPTIPAAISRCRHPKVYPSANAICNGRLTRSKYSVEPSASLVPAIVIVRRETVPAAPNARRPPARPSLGFDDDGRPENSCACAAGRAALPVSRRTTVASAFEQPTRGEFNAPVEFPSCPLFAVRLSDADRRWRPTV